MAAALAAIWELDGQAQAEGTDTGPINIHRRDTWIARDLKTGARRSCCQEHYRSYARNQ
jgi:hypothetical protein